MTRANQKAEERHFVEEAAKLLGVTWHLSDNREHPDFLVTEGDKCFGLEVTQVFAGEVSDTAGATMKIIESNDDKRIESLLRDYRAKHDVPLNVQFIGPLNDKTLSGVVDALVAFDFPSKPLGEGFSIDRENGLLVSAKKGMHHRWYHNNAGFVDRKPQQKIADAIKAKAQELPSYRSSAGADVRLLIVADRYKKSGKLALRDEVKFDLCGFQAVYFYSRPESVIVLRS
jgi:hypothetical protein